MVEQIKVRKNVTRSVETVSSGIWQCDASKFLTKLPEQPLFDLIVTSPPYNIGKPYEKNAELKDYVYFHTEIIKKSVARLKPTGSFCLQVGNYVKDGEIIPLDFLFNGIFFELGMKLRNRIVWHFGHGLHQTRRFSGRYEVVLWFTKSDDYYFDLDAVRVPPKYPGKRSYRGPRAGELSGNPLGKNPEDVWEVKDSSHDLWQIPNVKAQHVEKTEHPCQFPVGLIERLVLSLTRKQGLVFDPFAGTASAGVAALLHERRFWGCEIDAGYAEIASKRLNRTIAGEERFRSHAKPIYDHRKSKLSLVPHERAVAAE
ncbi:site-specific DNA-methyltransferase [Fontisubflavum oceani]|uniref:DNA-methyltransferase n=1 Tax=Fontisubflavum oceani TaxID=2978973 RepID=UPI0025B43BA1|nr:site-specific DNA-methyltransferase [Fontisubflavum oceani]WJY21580.1 site-specific DNA-methyltransferase [Fontisubflavum oceani]